MAEPSTTTSTAPISHTGRVGTISPAALRVVLFGMPAAGKSSLLGAFSQASQTQEYIIRGRLIDHSEGHLAELQKRLYEENPRPTAEEVAPYAVEFEPFAMDGQGPQLGGKIDALLIDCDGRVANDLLARRQTLNPESPEGTLAREVIEADTLVLVVDAAAPSVQVDADFDEFGRFLRLLEKGRGQRTEVGGLPVFLVLTKCDLLAQPGDTAVDWMERIEERKRQVHRRFQDFLARQHSAEAPLPFGRIDLHLWATAVKRPPLGPTPAKPREPYGVAELFRQCFEQAYAFRQRRRKSGHRLLWTVGSAVGVLGVMAALAAGLILGNQSEKPNPLLNKVENYLSHEGQTPSTRLREPLQPKISELNDFKNDPNFSNLPAETQEKIDGRLQELQAYRAYKEQVQAGRPVASVQSDAELRALEESLRKLQVPDTYAKDWSQTEAVLSRDERLKDIETLRKAVDEAEEHYHKLKREGDRLVHFTLDQGAGRTWSDWYGQFKGLEARASAPLRDEEPLPGPTSLTGATVLRFNRVVEARGDWQNVQQRLERVRDLAAALGLIGSLANRHGLIGPLAEPLLVIPKPPDSTALSVVARVQELQKFNPRFKEELTIPDVSDSLKQSLRAAARTNYDNLLEVGQDIVLRRLQQVSADGRETVDHWREVRTWLADPLELTSWRALARVLGRLYDPDWTDPVSALAAFLGRDSFELSAKELTLEVPFNLPIRPTGKLSVFYQSAAKGPALVYETKGDPETDQDRRVKIYTLKIQGDAKSLTYKPGDALWASLPVEHGGKEDWVLSWVRGRSAVYQIDHLVRTPQLHPKDQPATRGEPAQGVQLRAAEGQLPTVPELMPVVKLEKR
jgi:GTPase SAR1 family protein